MTSTLQRLEAKGFIRVSPDPKDGRAKRIAITAKGRRARVQAITAIADDLAAIESAIGARELEAALPFLVNLRAFLDQRRNPK